MTGNSRTGVGGLVRACGLAAAVLALPAMSQGAATIVIVNGNAAGVGFNDPAPAAPVGGNPGTTLGQQRLNAFQAAAEILGAQLNSTVPIFIRATLTPLTCTATSAVLGSAGPNTVSRDFPGAPLPNTWYHGALANAILGIDDSGGAVQEINANFNSNLGNVGCLTGVPFYLGLDNNHGPAIDLVTVLLHEFAHGLGFSTFTNSSTGAQFLGFPFAYDHFLFDTTQNLSWVAMTNAQRAASAINARRLVWTGATVFSAVPSVLRRGSPNLTGLAPGPLARSFLVGEAAFGAPLTPGGLTGEVMPVVDQPDGSGFACTPLSTANALAVNGKIALVDRGVCAFSDKVKNVQNAGAIGAIVVDNVAGSPPPGLAGVDPTVTIPAVRITLGDGALFKANLRFRSRTRSGVVVRMELDMLAFAGTDAAGRALVFTPDPVQGGSSVSHWDTIMTPNQLMEPNINGDLSHAVVPPLDLTVPLLIDMGWNR